MGKTSNELFNNPFILFSILTTNNNAIYLLITKDQNKQKEEVNNLLSLEKEKFEEESPMSEEEKEYQDQYNNLFGDDQEMENIVLLKDKDVKKIKIIKISQKGEEPEQEKDNIQKENLSDISMRQSQNVTKEYL
jgi:uncharacterized protein YpmB